MKIMDLYLQKINLFAKLRLINKLIKVKNKFSYNYLFKLNLLNVLNLLLLIKKDQNDDENNGSAPVEDQFIINVNKIILFNKF